MCSNRRRSSDIPNRSAKFLTPGIGCSQAGSSSCNGREITPGATAGMPRPSSRSLVTDTRLMLLTPVLAEDSSSHDALFDEGFKFLKTSKSHEEFISERSTCGGRRVAADVA